MCQAGSPVERKHQLVPSIPQRPCEPKPEAAQAQGRNAARGQKTTIAARNETPTIGAAERNQDSHTNFASICLQIREIVRENAKLDRRRG
jgi:hypothetical protein